MPRRSAFYSDFIWRFPQFNFEFNYDALLRFHFAVHFRTVSSYADVSVRLGTQAL